MNRKFVDEFAVEFCMTMNFKGNRSRLARALFNVDKNRFLSRFVTGLSGNCMSFTGWISSHSMLDWLLL